MAKLVVQIPDAEDNRAFAALAAWWGYQAKVPDPAFVQPTGAHGITPIPMVPVQPPLVDNPETKKQFCNRKLAEYVATEIANAESAAAAAAAPRPARINITSG